MAKQGGRKTGEENSVLGQTVKLTHINGWMDGWIDGWMDGWIDGRGSNCVPPEKGVHVQGLGTHGKGFLLPLAQNLRIVAW